MVFRDNAALAEWDWWPVLAWTNMAVSQAAVFYANAYMALRGGDRCIRRVSRREQVVSGREGAMIKRESTMGDRENVMANREDVVTKREDEATEREAES